MAGAGSGDVAKLEGGDDHRGGTRDVIGESESRPPTSRGPPPAAPPAASRPPTGRTRRLGNGIDGVGLGIEGLRSAAGLTMTEAETNDLEGGRRARVGRRGPPRGTRRRTSRFRTGKALGGTLSAWLRNVVPFTILAVIVYLPLLGWQWWLVDHPQSWATADFDPINTVLELVLSFVLTATFVQAVFAQIRGTPMPMVRAVTAGLARLPAVIGVALVISMVTIATVLPGLLLGVTVQPELGMALTLPGMIVTLVLSCGWFVAVPVAVVESPGVIASLRRSWQLTRGLKWQIFVLLIVLGVMQGVGVSILGAMVAVSGGELDPAALDPKTFVLLMTGLAAVFGSIQSVAQAVVYHELRVEVEGMGEEELAAIFA